MDFFRRHEAAQFGFVYIFDGNCGEPIYIGSSKDIRNRLKTHLSLKGNAFRDKRDLERVSRIRISYVGTLETARKVESGLINKYNPILNSAPGVFPFDKNESDINYKWFSFSVDEFMADDTIVNNVFFSDQAVKIDDDKGRNDKEWGDLLDAERDACRKEVEYAYSELKECMKQMREIKAENKMLQDELKEMREIKAENNSLRSNLFLLNADGERNERSVEFWKKECDFYKEMYDSERAFLHGFMEKYQDFLKRIPIPLPQAQKKRRRLFGITS